MPFGNKAGEWEKKEIEGYKYRMMHWSNDVRAREVERQTGSVL